MPAPTFVNEKLPSISGLAVLNSNVPDPPILASAVKVTFLITLPVAVEINAPTPDMP